MSKYFKELVLWALILLPYAWYFLNQWLYGFAYKTEIGWWSFVLAGFLSLSTVAVTIGYQIIKAVLINPTNSLKSE